jgi:hypothetical protein
MRLDISKIDDRIERLQEIRRIAADPELASVLLEFIVTDETEAPTHAAEPIKPVAEAGGYTRPPTNDAGDSVEELVREIAGGSALWNKRRT